MREIKFKAWNSRLKKFTGDWMWDEDNGELKPFNKDVTLLQYTGIKDRDGKEIYEGDIVETEHKKMRSFKWKVIFEDGAFLTSDGVTSRCFYNYKFGLKYIIIGNVFENPELASRFERLI